MIQNIVMPKWGMGLEEGTIIKWLKSPGDSIAEGEPVAEVETAKATQEVESTISGVLVEVLIPEGETVLVNTPIARVESQA